MLVPVFSTQCYHFQLTVAGRLLVGTWQGGMDYETPVFCVSVYYGFALELNTTPNR